MTSLERPNILVIVFDSLSEANCNALSEKLPTITALRKKSVAFQNAYACSPESAPAQASLFTGLDMAAHGVWTNGVVLPEYARILPEPFRDAGYRTWLVGRRHLAGVSNWTTEHARQYEYHQVDWAHGPLHRSRQNAYLNWLQQTAPETYTKIFPRQANPDDTDIPPEQLAAMVDIADENSFNSWVGIQVCKNISETAGDQPCFGVAGFVVGETMGAAPNSGTCTEASSTRALRQADTALKAILESLEARGQTDNCVIALASTRGAVAENVTDQALQEAMIKVPLLIYTSGGKAKSVNAAVSTMDIAPTLYETAQIPLPQRIQGTSLLTGKPRGWALSRLRNPDLPHQTALSTERWKLVMQQSNQDTGTPPRYCLYDLHSDPDETTNLADIAAHQSDLENMIDLMIDARVALEDRTEPRIANF